jgi:hypothetical protein
MAENTELNLDRNWSFDVNLSGITVAAPIPKDVPKGFYKCKVEEMYVNIDKNPNRVVIKLTVAEGEFKNGIITDGLNIPKSEEDKVRYYWRVFAESAGYTPAQLDAGGLKLSPEAFKGREVHIQYTPKGENGGYDRTEYFNSTEFAARKAGANAAATATTSAAPKADTVSKGDLYAKLGIS